MVSNMVPMSANIAFVLYACNSTEKAGKLEYKLQVLVNEKPVTLPCCHGNPTCGLVEFLSCFKETVDSCDFEAVCSSSPVGNLIALAWIFSPQQLLKSLSLVFSLFLKIITLIFLFLRYMNSC